MRFIDLFCGIGGFHLALEKAGGTCVFSSDINPAAQETYFNNFGVMPSGDLTKIASSSIPDHEVLCAGFPCQAFSKAGRGQGFEDTRGTLFFEVLRIAKDKKPKIIFLENVAQLKMHDSGNTFKVIEQSLKDLGYHVSHEVLDAKDFGLPQSRKRIIIVASLDKAFDFNQLLKRPQVSVNSILEKTPKYLDPKEYTLLPINILKEQNSGLIFCGFRNKELRKGINESQTNLSRVHKQQNRIYHSRGVFSTLSSSETAGRYWVFDGVGVRKLSVRECYRLQGFSDDFKIHSSTAQQYKQIGNSVPVNLIHAVAVEIKKQLLD